MPRTRRIELKESMAEALSALMEQQPADKITIEMITDKAGVGRATWFRYFPDKKTAVIYSLALKWYRWAKAHKLENPSVITVDKAESFIEYIWSIRGIRQTLKASGLESCILESFVYVLEENKFEDPEEYYRRLFVAYGIAGIIEGWERRGYQPGRKEMARYLKEFIRGNLSE